MLDTIILEITIDFKAITDTSKFRPNARIFEHFKGYGKCTNNATAEENRKKIYRPKLTLMRRGNMIILKIEYSAPKIVFGNNLDEIEEKDYSDMLIKIQNSVKEMGVWLNIQQIETAKVIGFHPSKNIVLTNKYTSSFAIRELAKINISEKMDIEKVKFRNGGEALQLYSKIHSAVFYDKINDLTKPEKRAIDKDQNKLQKALFEFIKTEKKGLEVLRFEIRLSDSGKMKEILAEVGFNQEPILKNIFKKGLCQKIVKLYWEQLFFDDLFLFSTYNNPQKILEMILIKYPKTRIRTAVMLVGLNLLCKDDDGFKGFRKIVGSYKKKNNWLSLRRYLQKLSDSFFTRAIHGFVDDIQREIKEFEAFKLNKND